MIRGSDLEPELRRLEGDLRKLEAEYNMYFAGQIPRPPWETRDLVERSMKRMERSVANSGTYAEKFHHQALQSRLATFSELWERGLRAREEGRPGPFSHRRAGVAPASGQPGDRVICVAVFADPATELTRMRDLYDRLTVVRRELGAPQVPYHKFAEFIRGKVAALKKTGVPEVAIQVAVREGRVTLTARGVKDVPPG